MAQIRNARPKQSGGGYERLVGHTDMANIFTRAQSTVITNGTELEKIISEKATTIDDLDKFIEDCDKGTIPDGAYLCTKPVVKKSAYKMDKHEPDFIAFTVNRGNNICRIVELKDGDAFDTKKSAAEKRMLATFMNHLAPKIPFRTKYYICCFNQSDVDKIVTGFKHVFTVDEVMTGKEFCDILGINYDAIVRLRRDDAADNFEYVIEKMFEIKEVRSQFVQKHREHIVEDDFYQTNAPDEEDP